MPRTPGSTIPSQFRLQPDTITDLDTVAARLTEDTGITHSRTDAVRHSARQARIAAEKKSKNKSKKSV